MNSKFLMCGLIIALTFNTCFAFKQAKPIKDEIDGLTIEINPKIEAFGIMAFLSGNYDSKNDFEFGYKARINDYFSEYKNHKSISFLKKMMDNCGSDRLIKGLILNEEYRKDTSAYNFINVDAWNLPNNFSNKVKIVDSLHVMINLFVKETNFASFYNKNKSYFESKLNEVSDAISGKNIIQPLELFWGEKKDIYRIIIVLLEKDLHSQWFESDGKFNSIFYLPPKFLINNDVYFGNSDISNPQAGKMSAADYIYYGAGHEFGHSFINNITSNYTNEIDKLDFEIKTYDPTNTDFLNESILRSYTAYEFIKDGNTNMANMIIMGEAQNGYIYNKEIIELFKTYEGNRDKYGNFNDFMPEIITHLSPTPGQLHRLLDQTKQN